MTDGAPRASSVRSWGPDRRWKYVTLAAAAACVAWRVVSSDPENRLVALVLAVAMLLVTITLLRVRVRLTASAEGVSVTGPVHTDLLPWAEITSIESVRRGRFGRRGATLEIEVRPAGWTPSGDASSSDAEPDDTRLFAFGALELGADPAAVARALRRLRT